MYPQGRSNPFASVPEVDADTAYKQFTSGEVGILDVRDPYEWEEGHIEGVDWIPLDQLQMRWREVDPNRHWVCVCHVGVRSIYAAALLRQKGIEASSLVGGIADWQYRGLPVTAPGKVDSR